MRFKLTNRSARNRIERNRTRSDRDGVKTTRRITDRNGTNRPAHNAYRVIGKVLDLSRGNLDGRGTLNRFKKFRPAKRRTRRKIRNLDVSHGLLRGLLNNREANRAATRIDLQAHRSHQRRRELRLITRGSGQTCIRMRNR